MRSLLRCEIRRPCRAILPESCPLTQMEFAKTHFQKGGADLLVSLGCAAEHLIDSDIAFDDPPRACAYGLSLGPHASRCGSLSLFQRFK